MIKIDFDDDCNHQLCVDLDSPECLLEDEDERIIRRANKLLQEREDIVFVTDGNFIVEVGGIHILSSPTSDYKGKAQQKPQFFTRKLLVLVGKELLIENTSRKFYILGKHTKNIKKVKGDIMEVETLTIPKEEAQKQYDAYLEACKKSSHPYYNKMKSIYYQVKKEGLPILDVKEAIEKAGTTENKEPKFAIATADMKQVYFVWDSQWGVYRYVNLFGRRPRGGWNWHHQNGKYENIFSVTLEDAKRDLITTVPQIPPQHIPDGKLNKYHILWEVEKWREIPNDPILLKKIPQTESLFMVLAQWDLTELERKILADVVRI